MNDNVVIVYNGEQVSVPKEVADFLEQDRKREQAQEKQDASYHTLFGFFRQEGEPAAPPSCAAHQNCICTPPDTSDVWMRSCCPVRALTAMTQRCPSSVSHRYS